jgi:hypothetical protein
MSVEATYVDHPPSTEPNHDEIAMDAEEDVPSIEATKADNYAKYIDGAPEYSAPLNALNNQDDESKNDDPLATIPQAGPINDMHVTESPLLTTQHDAESPRAIEVPTTESPLLPSDGETDTDKPLGPPVSDLDTLADIEKNVEEFEGQASDVAPEQQENLTEEDARQAVMDAISQSGPEQYLPPNENIGAQFVPLDAQPQEVDVASLQDEMPAQGTSNPPNIPPPMMPQFPLPGVEVVEPPEN